MNKNFKNIFLILAVFLQVLNLNGLSKEALAKIPDSKELAEKNQAEDVPGSAEEIKKELAKKKKSSSKSVVGRGEKKRGNLNKSKSVIHASKTKPASKPKQKPKGPNRNSGLNKSRGPNRNGGSNKPRGSNKNSPNSSKSTNRAKSIKKIDNDLDNTSEELSTVSSIVKKIKDNKSKIEQNSKEIIKLKANKKTASKARALEDSLEKIEVENKELEELIKAKITKEINEAKDEADLNKKKEEFTQFIKETYTDKEFLGNHLSALNLLVENKKKDIILLSSKQGYFDFSALDDKYKNLFKINDNDELTKYKDNKDNLAKKEELEFINALLKFRKEFFGITFTKTLNTFEKYKKEVQSKIDSNFTETYSKGKIKINDAELTERFNREYKLYKLNQENEEKDNIAGKTKSEIKTVWKNSKLSEIQNDYATEKYLSKTENTVDNILKAIEKTNEKIIEYTNDNEKKEELEVEKEKLKLLVSNYIERFLLDELNKLNNFEKNDIEKLVKILDGENAKLDLSQEKQGSNKYKLMEIKKEAYEKTIDIISNLNKEYNSTNILLFIATIKELENKDNLLNFKKSLKSIESLKSIANYFIEGENALLKDYKYICKVFYSTDFFRNIIKDIQKSFEEKASQELKTNKKSNEYFNLKEVVNFLSKLLDIKTLTSKEFELLINSKSNRSTYIEAAKKANEILKIKKQEESKKKQDEEQKQNERKNKENENNIN